MSKKLTLAFSSICAGLSVVCAYLGRPTIEVMALVATNPVCDLGELFQGTSAHAEFDLTNTSHEELVIGNVITSCSCTEQKISKSRLSPGEKATLKVQWNTGVSRGKAGAQLTVIFRVRGSEQRIPLQIKGDVIPDFAWNPEQVTFKQNEDGKQLIAFSTGRQKDLMLTKAYCTHRSLKARLDPGSNRVEVNFEAKNWSEDSRNASLIVETNSSKEPSCRIPIRVLVSQ